MRRTAIIAGTIALVGFPATAVSKQDDGCQTKACLKRTCVSQTCKARVARKQAAKRPMQGPVTASWYGPGLYGNPLGCSAYGTLKTGTFGVAHKTLPCGTKVRLCAARCTTAPVLDRGPYVGGRTFDLTAPVRAAIGAPPLAQVRYRVLSTG